MDVILEFIFAAAGDNPVIMAACFMCFLVIVDAVFGFISTLFVEMHR